MSTITQPRDSSINGRRIPQASSSTSPTRPSLDQIRSLSASPALTTTSTFNPNTKRNRAALREYYNLRKPVTSPSSPSYQVADDVASEVSSIHNFSEIPESPLDGADFDAPKYIKEVLETQTLMELLKTHSGVLSDIRALDAERKALVYDNYSKLISATEMIGRMRERMQMLGPVASGLDPMVRRVFERVEEVRVEFGGVGREAKKREEARRGVRRVLEMPGRLREMVKEGKSEEARREWESVLKVLLRWKERGVGGDDVQECIDEGEAALRGEGSRI